jgi:hypothetical protein
MRNFRVMDIQNHHKPASHKSPSPKATTHFFEGTRCKWIQARQLKCETGLCKKCQAVQTNVRRKWGRVRLWTGLGGGIGCLRRVRLCKLVGRWTRLRPVSGRANNPRTDLRTLPQFGWRPRRVISKFLQVYQQYPKIKSVKLAGTGILKKSVRHVHCVNEVTVLVK